jgi:hypothetical protein
MQKMLNFPAKRIRQLARAVQGEADQINHGIRLQVSYPAAEGPGAFFSVPVGSHTRYPLPGRTLLIGRTLVAAYGGNLMPGSNQARYEISSNVSSAPDNDNSHSNSSFPRSRPGLALQAVTGIRNHLSELSLPIEIH